MLRILPLASSITPASVTAAVTGHIAALLDGRDVPHRFVAEGEAYDALLIVSGGTEHLALAASAATVEPVILLAHPERNSLPAALEILSRLRQLRRSGRIVLLRAGAEGDAALEQVARHVELRRRLRAARLGRVGTPSDWLVASVPSPEQVAAAWGPTVIDVPIGEVVEALADADAGEAAAISEALVAGATAIAEPSAADLAAAARVAVALRRVVRRHRLEACAVRCFDLVTEHGTSGCVALSTLLDEGVVAGCEGDVPATLTMLVVQLLTGQPAFVANPQDVDPSANTVSLAHCTIARRLVTRYALRSHFESGIGVAIEGAVPPGPATLARIGGADLRALLAADGEVVASGDSSRRCRTQVTVRLDTPADGLLARPLGNHHVLARGRLAAELHDYHELFVASS